MALILSDDPSRLDMARIHGWLFSSYWSPGIAIETLSRAFRSSHCLGAYEHDRQVGFARMITDHTTFAWLADVWVAEDMRGRGIAREMTSWFLTHRDFKSIRRVCLATRDAHGVYAALGFRPLADPELFMEREQRIEAD